MLKNRFIILFAVVISCVAIAVVGYSVLTGSKEEPFEGDRAEYMVEILLENKTDHRVENIVFGIADGNRGVLSNIHYKNRIMESERFLISYHADTTLFFDVKLNDEKITLEFDIKDMTDVYNPQQKTFNIVESDEKIEIKEVK